LLVGRGRELPRETAACNRAGRQTDSRGCECCIGLNGGGVWSGRPRGCGPQQQQRHGFSWAAWSGALPEPLHATGFAPLPPFHWVPPTEIMYGLGEGNIGNMNSQPTCGGGSSMEQGRLNEVERGGQGRAIAQQVRTPCSELVPLRWRERTLGSSNGCHLQSKPLVIESRWVSTPLASAGELRPRRLNNWPF
jgi:hypothetical protein